MTVMAVGTVTAIGAITPVTDVATGENANRVPAVDVGMSGPPLAPRRAGGGTEAT